MMASNISINSINSDVFFVEQLSREPNQQRTNSPKILISTELLGMHTVEMPKLSSVTSPVPDIVTPDDNSNDPTSPYLFGAQQPNVPPSLNDLNLPPNPFIRIATMAAAQAIRLSLMTNIAPVNRAIGTIAHFNPTHEPEYN